MHDKPLNETCQEILKMLLNENRNIMYYMALCSFFDNFFNFQKKRSMQVIDILDFGIYTSGQYEEGYVFRTGASKQSR